MFWSIKNSGEVLNKLKSRGFRATSLSTYDFSTLYTTLPHNLIKEKLINLIERKVQLSLDQILVLFLNVFFFSRKHIQLRMYFDSYRLSQSVTCIRSRTCTKSKPVYYMYDGSHKGLEHLCLNAEVLYKNQVIIINNQSFTRNPITD